MGFSSDKAHLDQPLSTDWDLGGEIVSDHSSFCDETTPTMLPFGVECEDDTSVMEGIQDISEDDSDWRLSLECAGEVAEEFELITKIDTVDDDQEFMGPTSPCGTANELSSSLSERFEASAKSLSESMRRSHETRMSLKLQTVATEKYPRRGSIKGVVKSVEESTERLQSCLFGKPTVAV